MNALLASLLISFVSSTELACEADENGRLVCSFIVDPSLTVKEAKLKDCTDGLCVEALVSTYPSPNLHANDKTLGALRIGKATYRKPYSQYTPDVAAWLSQAPFASIDNDPLEWAQWCGNLGTSHLTNAVEWYDLELAVNALEQSLLLIQGQTSEHSSWLQGWEEFTASVETNLGEAYFLDPQMNHFPQSLEHYLKALEVYQFLLQEETQFQPNGQMNRKLAYARINAKVGMTLLQMQSPFSTIATGSSVPGDGVMDSVTTLLNTESDSQDFLSRAKEALSVAIATYQPLCEKLSIKDDPALFVETCVEYASTLQYSATAESTSGDLPKAEQYMVEALAVYFGDQNILEATDNVDNALKDAYNVWYGSGAVDSIASTLVSVSNAYSQQGQYSKSKTAYRLAMLFYSRFNIAVPSIAATAEGILDVDESQMEGSLNEYFSLLTAYRRGTGQSAGRIPDGPRGTINHEVKEQTQNVVYQRDDGYEGDLLFNLGTIYLTIQQETEAVSWLEQAIELYERLGDERKPQIANAKASLSLLYFRMRRFDDAERAHFDSLDMYQALYGDGVNPYVQGLEEYQEELVQALEQLGAKNSNSDATASSNGAVAGGIDLDKYKQSIQNATEAAASAAANDAKEEL